MFLIPLYHEHGTTRIPKGASDGDEEEGAGRGAFRHANQHEQSCLYLERTRGAQTGSSYNGKLY
jgi:hypothetical protein